MANEKQQPQFVRLALTPDQKAFVKEQTGKDAEAIELSAQELEERIAPSLTRNHNESLLD